MQLATLLWGSLVLFQQLTSRRLRKCPRTRVVSISNEQMRVRGLGALQRHPQVPIEWIMQMRVVNGREGRKLKEAACA